MTDDDNVMTYDDIGNGGPTHLDRADVSKKGSSHIGCGQAKGDLVPA